MKHSFKALGIAFYYFLLDLWSYFRINFKLRNVFSIDGLLKILFLYSASVLWVILLNFDLPFPINHKVPTIAVYTTERIGEKLLHDRIKIAAKANGWNVIGGVFEEGIINVSLLKPIYYSAASLVNLIFKPQFNLAVTHYVSFLPYGYNVVYLNVPNAMLFDVNGGFKARYSHLSQYDAYVDLHSVMHGTNPILTNALQKLDKVDVPIVPLYLAQNRVEYSAATKEQILVIGSLWGCNRDSLRMKLALKALAEDDLLIAYGLEDSLGFLKEKYKGSIESFAEVNVRESLLQLQKKYGISLVVHNLEHMIEGFPTSRIAESIAAGALVISDQHPFIKKYFGDNVLYFDSLTDSDSIYKQIKGHAEWIRQNPETAETMTRAAYDIFMTEFALEDQLHKLYNSLISKSLFTIP